MKNLHSEHQSLRHLCQGSNQKPLEIYVFVDPLCPECWALEPILKKLQIEYGNWITLKHVLTSNLQKLNIGTKRSLKIWPRHGSKLLVDPACLVTVTFGLRIQFQHPLQHRLQLKLRVYREKARHSLFTKTSRSIIFRETKR